MIRSRLTGLLAAVLITGLVPVPAGAATPHVRLLAEWTVPFGLTFADTTVGGLSSIDRDPRTGEYLLISDDRSELQPARFYTADIAVDAEGVHDVRFTGTHPFLRPDGETYPPLKQWTAAPCLQPRQVCDRYGTVDPEELRLDPVTGEITWSQEGERILPDVLLDPSIRRARWDGTYLGQLPLPAIERMDTQQRGPRANQTLEGMTYAAEGSLLVSALEDPLIQDGPDPTPAAGALTRVTVQTRLGRVLAQYAYPLDPLFATPRPPNTSDTNGVSSILAYDPVDPTRYLAVERAYAAGVGNKVRVYETDTTGATNVRDLSSLAGAEIRPMRKRLLVDMDDVGLTRVDNIEGITWGPRLSTGERTLLLVSDNNFSSSQITELVALAVG
ncbi:MAG: esterase-like activity of phytase family protein [Kutzneria sp.]|nr:esterase-like activity of phytase family protein [Kutzneria sp.]MBV9844831.1 esterase-like activity of phytase family protein [Kutzneria sp.]